MLFEHAAKFVQSSLESCIVSVAGVVQIEVRKCFLARLPLVSLSVTFQSNLFIESVLDLPKSLGTDIVFRFDEVPSADDQLLKVLNRRTLTVCLSLGTQKLSSA